MENKLNDSLKHTFTVVWPNVYLIIKSEDVASVPAQYQWVRYLKETQLEAGFWSETTKCNQDFEK